jgi:hypothetical protein
VEKHEIPFDYLPEADKLERLSHFLEKRSKVNWEKLICTYR